MQDKHVSIIFMSEEAKLEIEYHKDEGKYYFTASGFERDGFTHLELEDILSDIVVLKDKIACSRFPAQPPQT